LPSSKKQNIGREKVTGKAVIPVAVPGKVLLTSKGAGLVLLQCLNRRTCFTEYVHNDRHPVKDTGS